MKSVHRRERGVIAVKVIGEGSLLMCVCDSERLVIIREGSEQERREEEMNSQWWQRLGGHWRGSVGL